MISPTCQQSVCFLPLTTHLLAQTICKNGNYFAWQGISLKLNNGCSCEIWQQGLTFGPACLLPVAYLRKQVVFCTPSGRGVAGNPNLSSDLELTHNIGPQKSLSDLWGRWEKGQTQVWPSHRSTHVGFDCRSGSFTLLGGYADLQCNLSIVLNSRNTNNH